jgi:hypothetical protein
MLIRGILILVMFALTACITEEEQSSNSQSPREYPSVATPEPIISQEQFLDIFADLCLVSPRKLTHFQRTAASLGLVQTEEPSEDYEDGEGFYVWRKKPYVRRQTALEIRVGSGRVLYEVGPGGIPSGSEDLGRGCWVDAYLAEKNDLESQAAMKTKVREEFQLKAKNLDFSAYSGSYKVTGDDIELELINTPDIDALQPLSNCPSGEPCMIRTSTRLSLSVVLSRYP